MGEMISNAQVDEFYTTKFQIWEASPDELRSIASIMGIQSYLDAKDLFNQYYERNYRTSTSPSEQFTRLQAISNKIIQAAKQSSFMGSILEFGSYGSLGVVNRHSDLDYIIIMNRTVTGEDVKRFAVQVEQLLTFSSNSSWSDLGKISTNNQTGLCRLYALDDQAVEVEFHIIGENDARTLGYLQPNRIERVRPGRPKTEKRKTILGRSIQTLKPADHVLNHFWQEGELVKGFFPEQFLLADIKYDPTKVATTAQKAVWYSVLKSYAYYIGAITRDNQRSGWNFDVDRISFESFISTLYYSEKRHYSRHRLEVFEQSYYVALNKLCNNRWLTVRRSR